MIAALLAAILSVAPYVEVGSGAFGLWTGWKEFHPQQLGEVKPQSPDWYEGCSNAFKSFNPDTGLWKDASGRYHYCRLKYVTK